MKIRFLFTYLVIFAFSLLNGLGQNPPCLPEYPGLTYTFPIIKNCPPYSTDMSIDVKMGYSVLDSISKNVEIEDFYSFLNRQTYNDTIRTLMKYYYKMVEYDPVKFFNYSVNSNGRKFGIMDYDHPFFDHVKRISNNKFLDATLLASHLIAKVTVNSVSSFVDTTAVWAKTTRIVTSSVDRIFKGNPLVNCGGQLISNTNGNNCVKFEYAKEWFENSNPEFEMLPGQSFFIFFDFRLICQTDLVLYCTLFPLGSIESKTWSIYPIVNDNLIDLYNELGFGTSVNLNTFYIVLLNRINQIKNFTP